MSRFGWRPYVPVAMRRAHALREMERLSKQGVDIKPVEVSGRKIARTFWGEAWCKHLESFSDYANRLPRGRTYVRNGSVCHLEIFEGKVSGLVFGSELYTVEIVIETLPAKKWSAVKKRCAGEIGSLLELLQGRFSGNVMSIVTDHEKGIFPLPREINLKCSCPDWAVMCKHVSAVLYGVGARFDEQPELLFLMRGVAYEELISAEVDLAAGSADAKNSRRRISEDALSEVFGIDMDGDSFSAEVKPRSSAKSTAIGSSQTPLKARKSTAKQSVGGRSKKAQSQKRLPVGKRTTQTTRVSGVDISALRVKFDMSRRDFAALLGVSIPSIINWEKNPGPLKLQKRTMEAWLTAKKLTKKQARRKVS